MLTYIRLNHIDEKSRKFNLYKCSCGNEKILQQALVRSGNTKSCGCLSKKVKADKRLPDNYSEVTAIILGYKRHANSRKYSWCLSRDFVEDLIKKDCHYCKSPPSNLKKTKNSIGGLKYNGIDRVNNSLGYTTENVVPCCNICNRAKMSLSYDEFINWVKRLAEQWG
ncbi:HNH endonuclease protein [Rhizobium phage RHph_I3_11]|nr:HNH endonuclease protein [Rhizobium phage RHph_I3_11]